MNYQPRSSPRPALPLFRVPVDAVGGRQHCLIHGTIAGDEVAKLDLIRGAGLVVIAVPDHELGGRAVHHLPRSRARVDGDGGRVWK